jgi:hypothetical protein
MINSFKFSATKSLRALKTFLSCVFLFLVCTDAKSYLKLDLLLVEGD